MNALNLITPYLHDGAWVFDDASRGLDKEPFVCGMPEMIRYFTSHLPNPETGFQIIFSAQAFPGFQSSLDRADAENGGTWYEHKTSGMRGWLCPALLKYFEEPPTKIFFACEALQ